MSAAYRAVARLLIRLLIKRIADEHVAYMAEAYLQDLGDDDCPVCMANRRREAWLA